MARLKTEAEFRGELFKLMRRCWLWPKTTTNAWVCHRCGARNLPEGNVPDLVCHNAPVAIEVKMFSPPKDDEYLRSSFAFSDITPGQRQWLFLFSKDNGLESAYLGIGMRHGRAGTKKEPRRAWLPPWSKWLVVERLLVDNTGNHTLPLFARPHISHIAQKQLLVAEHLLGDWELVWNKGGWHLPPEHPLCTYLRDGQERDTEAEAARWR